MQALDIKPSEELPNLCFKLILTMFYLGFTVHISCNINVLEFDLVSDGVERGGGRGVAQVVAGSACE